MEILKYRRTQWTALRGFDMNLALDEFFFLKGLHGGLARRGYE